MSKYTQQKIEYLAGASIRELAKKYKIQYRTLAAYAQRHKWSAERGQALIDIKDGIHDRLVSKCVDSIYEKLEPLQKAADMLSSYTVNVLSKFPSGETDLLPSDVRALSASLKDLTQVMRNLYDIPTESELEARRINARRLELDEDRAEREKNEQEDTAITITMGGPVEEFSQ